ncbi:XXYS1_4_G0040530.mRNA.1.CDS.1 [Saccharomyces cerevisiae]|nr:EM14S01-3B_G0037980.mRNA.1.CDS.1 [Saccharomyces cerevisiae]CAD6637365.1 XXYS1_4_G0040530.mRNA.1.CDS.1 [Saccharomyces cerevisiae]CAI4680780.1 AMH_1a_G0036300.mRNA.1.CDS.1 [Saccharomyces cerevisiae]CAI4685213.1 CEI_1a_G0036150.mRNA.1.CDS.1 [Saccharomyces cerevisiae]CAI6834466.1 AMH_1a_G0036300.mRNA.1.CDS.1 [Saccharomyces cerevisiae]
MIVRMIRLCKGTKLLRSQFASASALYSTKSLFKPPMYQKAEINLIIPHRKQFLLRSIRLQSDIAQGKTSTKPTLKLSNANSKSSGFKDIKRLFVLSKPESKYIGLALLLILISSSVSMAVPSVIGKLLDLASKSDGEDEEGSKSNKLYGLTKKQFFTALGAVFIIGAVANASRIIILKVTGERLVARLRTRTMKAALDQDATFLDTNRVGDLISRLSSDASIVAKSVTQNVSDGTRAIIQGFVGFGMMSFLSWKLTCVMMILAPPLGAMALIYGRKIRNLSRQLQTSVGGLTKVAEEQLNATRTIQAYGGEKNEVRRYAKEVRNVFHIGLKEAVTSGLFFGSTGLVGNTAMLSLLLVGTSMIQSGSMTVGELSSFMMYAVYTGSSLFGLSSFYSELMKGAGAAARVFELNDRKPLIRPTIGKDPVSLAQKPIVFKNVSFTYPTRPKHQIFKDLNITIKPGEHVCAVGPSGSGKSTIASLLLRYYDVNSGSIEFGDEDIRNFNLRKYRRLIGYVQQEPLLFNGTILDNILYCIPPEIAEQDDRIRRAIGKANCTKFLANFPDGLQTMVGARGAQLSGGQKQRIALARAFLLDPAVLILDEATSALDSQSEEIVAKNLQRRVERGFTTISIAHRLSTIKHSTRVIVLGKHGSVVETGSFRDLIAIPNSELNALLAEQQDEEGKGGVIDLDNSVAQEV